MTSQNDQIQNSDELNLDVAALADKITQEEQTEKTDLHDELLDNQKEEVTEETTSDTEEVTEEVKEEVANNPDNNIDIKLKEKEGKVAETAEPAVVKDSIQETEVKAEKAENEEVTEEIQPEIDSTKEENKESAVPVEEPVQEEVKPEETKNEDDTDESEVESAEKKVESEEDRIKREEEQKLKEREQFSQEENFTEQFKEPETEEKTPEKEDKAIDVTFVTPESREQKEILEKRVEAVMKKFLLRYENFAENNLGKSKQEKAARAEKIFTDYIEDPESQMGLWQLDKDAVETAVRKLNLNIDNSPYHEAYENDLRKNFANFLQEKITSSEKGAEYGLNKITSEATRWKVLAIFEKLDINGKNKFTVENGALVGLSLDNGEAKVISADLNLKDLEVAELNLGLVEDRIESSSLPRNLNTFKYHKNGVTQLEADKVPNVVNFELSSTDITEACTLQSYRNEDLDNLVLEAEKEKNEADKKVTELAQIVNDAKVNLLTLHETDSDVLLTPEKEVQRQIAIEAAQEFLTAQQAELTNAENFSQTKQEAYLTAVKNAEDAARPAVAKNVWTENTAKIQIDNCFSLNDLQLNDAKNSQELNVTYGKNLTEIPAEFAQYDNIKTLRLMSTYISEIKNLPENITTLSLAASNIESLGTLPPKLKLLDLRGNEKLRTVEGLPHTVEKLYLNGSSVHLSPEDAGLLKNVKELYIDKGQFSKKAIVALEKLGVNVNYEIV